VKENTMKKTYRAILTCATMLTVVAGASADEQWTQPGLECDNGTPTDDAKREWRGTGPGNIICPITRPRADLTGAIADIFVRVDDQNATQGITCQAASGNTFGTLFAFSSADTSNGTGHDSLSLGSIPTPFASSYAHIGCNFPAKEAANPAGSKVINYRYTD
jgi:hypothetical protein